MIYAALGVSGKIVIGTAINFNEHPETVKTLIEAGADVNAKTKYGKTALMLAAEKGHTETANLLKKHGARK